ncbi:MAG: hypothetical protein JST00_17585 [Deltaproteobacteria bacterium]|nr:hypothetical protein [Deltaproteobacteria bacterium]
MSTGKTAQLVTEKVAKELRKVPERRLDVDWLAVDPQGHIAFFVANEAGPIPRLADTTRVEEALLAQLRVAETRRAGAIGGAGYRGSAMRAEEPVFDAPRGPGDVALHEERFDGYPHLVVSSDGVALRPHMDELGAREALARDAFAAIFPEIDDVSWDEIHAEGICIGCRVLDLFEDPRPRAPEAVATAGLYVYAHVDEDPREPYVRVASPSVPADLADLEPIVRALAELVTIPVPFEQARTVGVTEELGVTEIARREERERARQSRRPAARW